MMKLLRHCNGQWQLARFCMSVWSARRKGEPTDLAAALDIARTQVEEMKTHVDAAKEANNIDAAVNLAATSKRLLSLIADGEKNQ